MRGIWVVDECVLDEFSLSMGHHIWDGHWYNSIYYSKQEISNEEYYGVLAIL